MKKDLQIAVAAKVFRYLDEPTTDRAPAEIFISEADYFDPEQARAEREKIFKTHPQIVGVSAQIPKPGDFLTVKLAGIPIIIARQEDGSVKAFRNACRHRCAKILDAPTGQRRVFSCPYHGWTYALSGELRSIPDGIDSFNNIDLDQYGLIELAITEKLGLIWALAGSDKPLDIDAFLGEELIEQLESLNIPSHHFFHSDSFEQPTNWKLIVDGFLETYHVRYLHASTLAKIAVSNLLLVDRLGPHMRLVSARKDIEKLRHIDPSDRNLLRGIILTYVIMPGTVLVYVRDHLEIWSVTPHPTDATKCEIVLRFLTESEPKTDKEKAYWERNWSTVVTAVDLEDWSAARGIQENVGNGEPMPYILGRNEIGLHHFHRYLAEMTGKN